MFVCDLCKQSFRSTLHYVRHTRVHSSVPNATFPCGVSDCHRRFGSYTAIKQHVQRDHRHEREAAKETVRDVNLRCALLDCRESFDSVKSLLLHIKKHISHGVQITCPFSECTRKCGSQGSFNSHLSRYHPKRDVEHLSKVCRTGENTDSQLNSDYIIAEFPVGLDVEENENDELDSASDPTPILERSIALLYLKLQAKHHVTDTVIQNLISELYNVHNIGQEHFTFKLKASLLSHGVSEDNADDIVTECLSTDVFRHCHHPLNGVLRTKFCRTKYYQSHFQYVSSEEIYLGLDKNNQPSSFHYVPILTSLRALFEDSSVRHQYLNPEERPENKSFTDFFDGSVFKNNSLFKEFPSALKVLLYQDSFEIVNPLGSAKKKHKILAVYYNLGNLHVHCRSKIDAIQLVLLCKEKYFEFFGQEKIFAPLIRDLIVLEEQGIDIPSLNLNDNVRGGVVCILGDSLGSNCIGGFVQNFSKARYCCRFCLMQTAEFDQSKPCCLGEKRNIINYNEAVVEVSNDDSVSNYEGIKFNSVFNQLKYFHVCAPGLPPCLAHDLFEGVIQYDLALYLNYFIGTKQWLTWDYFSRKYDTFPFIGDDAKDKPNANDLKKGDKIGGQAFQTWIVLRFISVVIGSKIQDTSDCVWQNLLLLQKIVQLILSPKITKDQIGLLFSYLEEYMESRVTKFGDHKLKPKHHFLCHYPGLMLEFGPLVRLWTMRYESKHSYFKKCVRHCQNFKNVTKMLSHRHQLLQAYYSAGNLFGENVKFQDAVPFHVDLYSQEIQHAVCDVSAVTENGVSMVEKLEVYGTEYKSGSVLILRKMDYDLTVGIISMILVSANADVYFVVRSYRAVFIPEMNYYELETSDERIDAWKNTSRPLKLQNKMAEHEEEKRLFELPDIRMLLEDFPPNLQFDICAKLTELGISQASDMRYLTPEKDLADLLRPIQARKMAARISDMFAVKDDVPVNSYGPKQGEDIDISHTPASPAPSSSSSSSSHGSQFSPSISPSQNWISSFKIPFNKFPVELINVCEKGQRPKTPLRLEMIRILCSEISRYTRLPGKANVEIIAGQLVGKYPNSFMEKIGSEILGTGHSGLVKQIMDRMANAYGRGMRSKRSLNSNDSSEDSDTSNFATKRKLSVTDSYGCINFNPTALPESETEESLVLMQQTMKLEAQKPKPQRDLLKEKLYMRKTYILQRRSINQNPPITIREIKDEWPLLFSSDHLLDHFEELTGINIQSKLSSSLADKTNRLFNFVTQKRKGKGVKTWIDRISMVGGLKKENYSLIIPVLCACFGEDPGLLIKTYEETMNTADVEMVTSEVTPHIAVIGELCAPSTKYFLLLEKSVVAEEISSFECAVTMAFASYFVFNLQYHSGLPATLEFIQRCFLDLNPSRGSKSKAKKSGVANTKVVGFLRAYEEFDWNIGD